jgi:xylulokinase
VARAVFEGVTFSLKECLDLLCAMGQSCRRVRVSGGGSRSAFWRQMMADVFGVEIVEVNVTQGAAYGAALLAGVGAGLYRDTWEACDLAVREAGSTLPGPDASAYVEPYGRHRSLYPALRSEFRALAATVAHRTPADADRGR